MKVVLSQQDRQKALSKADSVQKSSFEAEVSRSVSMVYKADDDFFIWGPASVEIVDKENDMIRVEALEKALPQLLKRASLSYAHTDQIVGRILDGFKTAEPVEVEINGETYERQEFPTDVLDLDKSQAEALYVAGEVYEDTEQSSSVRSKIESNEVNSYSISGEALVTRKQVEGDTVYDDILELDLSAVTLCEEGMNQKANFDRVDGNVEQVDVADSDSTGVEKEFVAAKGSLSSPNKVSVSKSMSSKSSDSTDAGDSLSDDAAVKSLVKQEVRSQFEEQFEKHFDVHFADRADKMVKQEVVEALPDANLATKAFVEKLVQQRVEEELEALEREDDEMEDEEEEEEEEEMEEEKGEEEDMPEEMEEEEEEDMPEEMEGEKQFSEQQLKEELPSDVYNVVSEYMGTSKGQTAAADQEDELESMVKSVLSGEQATTPDVSVSDREEEVEKFEDEDVTEDDTRSPALENFDHLN